VSAGVSWPECAAPCDFWTERLPVLSRCEKGLVEAEVIGHRAVKR